MKDVRYSHLLLALGARILVGYMYKLYFFLVFIQARGHLKQTHDQLERALNNLKLIRYLNT